MNHKVISTNTQSGNIVGIRRNKCITIRWKSCFKIGRCSSIYSKVCCSRIISMTLYLIIIPIRCSYTYIKYRWFINNDYILSNTIIFIKNFNSICSCIITIKVCSIRIWISTIYWVKIWSCSTECHNIINWSIT